MTTQQQTRFTARIKQEKTGSWRTVRHFDSKKEAIQFCVFDRPDYITAVFDSARKVWDVRDNFTQSERLRMVDRKEARDHHDDKPHRITRNLMGDRTDDVCALATILPGATRAMIIRHAVEEYCAKEVDKDAALRALVDAKIKEMKKAGTL